jgi:hypothetical protein
LYENEHKILKEFNAFGYKLNPKSHDAILLNNFLSGSFFFIEYLDGIERIFETAALEDEKTGSQKSHGSVF